MNIVGAGLIGEKQRDCSILLKAKPAPTRLLSGIIPKPTPTKLSVFFTPTCLIQDHLSTVIPS